MTKDYPESKRTEVFLEKRMIGPNHPVYIIAEAGVAHFGEIDNARQMIDIAAEAKADAVKFQIYNTDLLIGSSEPEWQERLRTKELPYEAFLELKKYAETQNIDFFVTAHEECALKYIIETLKLKVLKIGSGEVGNELFLRNMAKLKLPTMISLGLHGEDEIESVVKIFEEEDNPNLILLHCVTQYPTPPEESNLKTISWLQKKYPYPIGYSDHSVGHDIPLAAVALGACVIEKHFFIDRNIEGSQDAYGACDKNDLAEFIRKIRRIESAIGQESANPNKERLKNLSWARKSILTVKSLRKGHILKENDLIVKRPGTGISPESLNQIIGKTLLRDVTNDHVLNWDDLK